MSAGWIVLALMQLGTIGTDYPGKWWVKKNEGLSKA